MVFQMQFLSTLRMLEANISAPFMKLLDNLKWLNLHFDTGLGAWLACGDEVEYFAARLFALVLAKATVCCR